ncbi:M56 family metallopeptidase [Spirosoma endophyticum]|uniref:BlaR1 peptidase M56 n=1 Tax=Spirosoma endophyticum TaxID=662367 RepID=A0A1I1X9H7_9BACT|nr:M56 family metallopeptidase [Spirosoma endophyticum]SFE02383.1 BlaR1 peptidase M56 [Spirosoma endophyticum]
MNTFNFLSSPVADALGWTLLHAIWQGFALVLPVAIGLHLLRNQSSVLRYRVGVLTLLTQLMTSVATFVWYYNPASTLPVPATLTGGQIMSIRWQTVTQTLPWHQQMQQFLESHLSQFVLTYLIGVALFGVRLAGGWVYLQQLSKTASLPATVVWDHMVDRLRAALAIRAVVQVRESGRIAMPMVVGILKPVLLLPIGLAAHLSTREIEAVLAHELAHVKRHDYGVNLLQSIVEILYFFHPALWWLSARVREEREHCCDDLAVQACGGDGRILAQALARVEELRLSQLETPALAMAFASKRQHLLHRVRRMLGAPTRPFVSNGSLVGLTLATILLMSVSVYAVQQQDKPKSRNTQPQPTRRHKAGNGTEFSITDNKKVNYVIWKGQKLPAKRVAHLQRQLDQIMAGQLSLDALNKSDRDILLSIIETNQGFGEGMDALGKGLAHIDYDNIVASALNNVPLSPDGTVEGLAKADYNAIISDAFASLGALKTLPDSLVKRRAYQQRQMDSLSQLLAQRSQQAQALRSQMEKFRFPIDELNRNQEVFMWRQNKLMAQREALIEKHQRLLENEGKQKLSQAEVEKQLAALEPEIKKIEGNAEELSKQVDQLKLKQDEFKLPMDKLKHESEQLDAQINQLADQLGQYGDEIARFLPDAMEPLERLEIHEAPELAPRPARTPRIMRTPRPAVAPNAVHPATPAMPAHPRLAPVAPAPASPRAKVAIPKSPKSPLVPKVEND